jgi:uncharacterized membrane protein
MFIPIMTFLANIAILLDIPILREAIVFIFLSFVPGFALLRLFKLKEISFLDTLLFSVALSIVSVMFIGLLVNELYLFLGLSQPLSTIPLTVAISAFALIFFLVECKRDLPDTLNLKTGFDDKLKYLLPLYIILFLLPLLTGLGVLYLNVYFILVSYATIAALCVMSVVSRRLVPENLYPIVIFSVSIALVCQVPLTSKYIVGWDANLEYYVFRLTQINGHWGFLSAHVNSLITLDYNSMLSITLLPAVYSALMHAQGQIIFKTLYPFIFSLVPLTMYRICEKQLGKLIALLSAFFFIFNSTAFYGTESLDLNRQIVGEFFLLLSVFLLINKAIPVAKRRLLLIAFGVALIVSHYSLAYVFLAIIAIVFIISKVKPGFDDTLNIVTVLALVVTTFLWYSLGSSAPIVSLIGNIKGVYGELITGVVLPLSGTAGAMFTTPQVFTATTWINLLLGGMADLFLMIGFLAIILRLKGKGIFAQFKVILTLAAIILVVSLTVPSIASTLNFTRFYAITMVFLAPCFVSGGQTLLELVGKAWIKIKGPLKHQTASKSKNIDLVILLIAILLSAYFLSQAGFINRVANNAVHAYSIDFDRLQTSNNSQNKMFLYAAYIPEQDVFSSVWLLNHRVATATVYADAISGSHALLSYGLMPNLLVLPITNTTIPEPGSFVYLGSLNIANGVITTFSGGSFNTSEISFILNQNNIVYSNGNNEILYTVPAA